MNPETPPVLNHFEGEVVRLMRGLDADEQRTALQMMKRYVELLPEISARYDERTDRRLEGDD